MVGQCRHINWYNELTKHAIEMGLGLRMYIQNFIETDSGVQKLKREFTGAYRQLGESIRFL
jgi:hypothetical protein